MVNARSVIGFIVSWCVVSWGCVPVPSDQGGSIPPPTIDSGEIAPPFDPSQDFNGGDGTGGDTLVFAVSVDAHSLAVDAIIIDAVLSVVQRTDTLGGRTITEATLQDVQNTAPIAEIGIVGELFLTASRGSFDGFDLTGELDGGIVAVFSAGVGQTNPNRFVLPEGAQAFVPGALGITHEVGAGSRFSFVINGDRVTGAFELNGFPIATFGESEVYEGTFTGILTR